ncbi:16S rRNA (uracil(1498)-N(3))-methyltransferase [Desulfovirgula thermocuniculi]|uniref:16S rRNA (uracil(1498)-N(3))-methyltransferase n=1 Tax=Desulfovirgula thermocuniculi TaxID=348842 RepID=UPI00040C80AE|nr:16S rRNA (uracil(1498)-N(3))-methyltransferase [Desulfovirgula thermocuniculi]
MGRHFFVPPRQICGNRVYISGSDAAHIYRVLRLRPGDVVNVLDGSGTAYRVELTSTAADRVEGLVRESFPAAGEPPVRVTLAQGLSKGEKMDIIIQKSVELGASAIIPVSCSRSVVRLTREKARERQERWQRIAREAAKQCLRAVVPLVGEVVTLEEVLGTLPPRVLALMPWEGEKSLSLKEALRKAGKKEEVFLFIGPEGGFAPAEVELARQQGVITVTLGPRILRTETAALAALAVVLYELGDLGR